MKHIFDKDFWLLVAIVLALWFVVSLYGQEQDRFLGPKIAAFNTPYGRFVREYYACPLNASQVEECKGAEFGITDYKAYQQARNAAKKLFDLEDPQ